MLEQFELTFNKAKKVVEKENYHFLWNFTSACLQDINEYYKTLENGNYSLISTDSSSDEEWSNSQSICDLNQFLKFVLSDDSERASEEDIQFILEHSDYHRETIEEDCYSKRKVRLLRLALEDGDKELENAISKDFEPYIDPKTL